MANQRLLPIKNGYNFRDLGGYPTVDGHTTKWQRLLRTGSLAQLGQDDLKVLDAIPVTIDVDLRAPDEVKKAPDRVPATAAYYHLPVFQSDETDASHSDEEIAAQMQKPGNGYHHMIDVYQRMTTVNSAKQAYQDLFKLLLSNKHGALLFHCTAGKDRTGMASFLILSALGVEQKVIIEDYLLTNTVTQEFRNNWLQEMRDNGASEELVTNRAALASVAPDYINTAIKNINQNYGNVDHYLNEYLGITPAEIKELRELYLD
ncbi:tyrosine-protein phosphatase [Limosilactobacillus sp. RRLNB_1_1]|uniref:Tyrosine-protein phosphatase n=1 Tax=Limosilactobacillus albertensis TaxID=2759752 RepID=A0A7W3TS32_9LACO|nr:tyrosine-protein phosphatase [Limosilactobacillus albertensis]MBB1069571.1 tyrosine-protein phosphatase [Limosilactobacillus albertensis]MCD7118097.1 tyrosine-protein phosphatase [Limosilactobacillus albertensis]MCD7127649.1 tyrosine-protein phosphatase [Limosilactobacillus albertensis]